jgi:hypothetical protein
MHLTKLCAFATIATVAAATAAVAATTQVNIADPTATTRIARVEPGSRLAVQEVEPTSFFHLTTGLGYLQPCTQIAAPPNGKALIVRQVRLDISTNGGNGAGYVALFANADCALNGLVGRVTPTGDSTGLSTMSFDPGLSVPAGHVLSAQAFNQVFVYTFVDGYTVASQVAPVGKPFR